MKDVELPLRIGYVALLNNMVVEGKEIKVYDKVADFATQTPYIVIEGMVPISDNTKDTFLSEVTVDLLVYTSFKGDFGGSEMADKISNEILQKVIPSPGKSGVSATGFNVFRAKQIGTNGEMIGEDTKRTYRKRITIEHLVEQI